MSAPFLTGLLSCVFIALSVFVVAKLLELERPVPICCIAGALSTSITVTFLNATYTPWFDADMLSLMLSVLAVYICARSRLGFIGAAVLLAASMAIYQSYAQVFVSLALILAIVRLLDGEHVAEIGKLALRFLLAGVLAAVLYVVGLQVAMALAQATVTQGYNGLADVGNYEGYSLLGLVARAYALPLAYLACPETHFPVFAGALNIAVALSVLIGIVIVARRKKLTAASCVAAVACILALPLGCDFIYVISHGVVHGLMIHAYSLFYVLAIAVACGVRAVAADWLPKAISKAVLIAVMLVFALNVVYSNDLYVRKDMQAQATLSAITRIIDRIEQVPGYDPGKTQVVLVGSLDDSSVNLGHSDYPPAGLPTLWGSLTNQVRSTGFSGDFSVTYPQTYSFYFDELLGYRMNLAGEGVSDEFAVNPQVEDMPAFPSADCCNWVDGSLVVKLS